MAKLNISRNSHGLGNPKEDLDIDDVPNPINPFTQDSFRDPRVSGDRRNSSGPLTVPAAGCRRKNNRRTAVYIRKDEWWMKRNYNNDL